MVSECANCSSRVPGGRGYSFTFHNSGVKDEGRRAAGSNQTVVFALTQRSYPQRRVCCSCSCSLSLRLHVPVFSNLGINLAHFFFSRSLINKQQHHRVLYTGNQHRVVKQQSVCFWCKKNCVASAIEGRTQDSGTIRCLAAAVAPTNPSSLIKRHMLD